MSTARLLLGAVVCVSLGAVAQVTTATFYGIVNDPTGATVPAAVVTLVNQGTGARATRTADASGEFVFDFVPVGDYTLVIEAPGFKKFENRGIELRAAQNIRRTFVLQLGSVTETVTVEADAPLVNTVSTEQREARTELEVRNLPLARRNYSTLLAIGTGVTYTDDSGNGVRLNGLGKSGTNVTVDGTDASANPEGRATSMYQGFNYVDTLSIEAIQEVQVIKGVVQAEYGQTLSGNVNLITKGGTNDWHGSAFENFQAENLNARHPFLNRRDAAGRVVPKDHLVFNQFGASIGGPIKRDRIFIFGGYEGYRERAFRLVQGNAPTQRLREDALRAQPIYKRAFDTMPLPNLPHAPDADAGVFLSASGSAAQENHAVVKGDVRVGSSGSLGLTYTRGRPFRLLPSFRIGNDRNWNGTQERGTANFIFGSANWTSETRFGYNLNDMFRIDAFFTGGIDAAFPETQFGGRRIPAISLRGQFGTADSEIIQLGGPVWTLDQKYARHLGSHSFKFGGKYSRRGGGRSNIENARVNYDTRAELLANTPVSTQVTFGVNPYKSQSYEWGIFAQDDWRVSPKLIVNLGIRYDFFSKFVAEPTTDAPAALFNLDGLLDNRFTFGPFRDPLDPFENDPGMNLGPRVGFAWNPDGRGNTVVRGGFSVMFSPLMWGTFNNAVANSQTVPFRVNLSRAEIGQFGLRFPIFNEDVRRLVDRPGGRIQIADIFKPDIEAPYSMNLYLGVQRSLTSSTVLETAFVGNRGVKFFMYRRFNPVDRLTGERPNPNLGEGNYLDDSQNTVYYSWQSSLRKRYSNNLTGSVHYTWGKALSYTGGDIGATFQGDATSVVQDFFNWRAERGPSAGDVTHYFVADWVYDLPLFSRMKSVARNVAGGWQVSGIFRAQSGGAFTIGQGSNISASRADYIGGNPYLSDYRDTLVYLNTAAFARVPVNPTSRATVRPGNIGNGALRGPGRWHLDLALGKNFRVTEGVQFQFRADMFNALNHVNLGGPVTSILDSRFGRITGASSARVIQLNARLSF